MPADRKVDELYQLPLSEFTTARNALAKTLKGEEAARVKRLEKPTLVPWSVNQLYWRERKTFDRLIASGRALRAAQIAALKGKATDVRAATSNHRAALADAIATATQLAAQSGAHPQPEPLSRMLEALSLAPELPADIGRLTGLVQPAGFEALAGITPAAKPSAPAHERRQKPEPSRQKTEPSGDAKGAGMGRSTPSSSAATAAAAAAERRRAEEAAAARKAAEADVQTRQRELDRARAALTRSEAHADTVRQQLARAEEAVNSARDAVTRAEQELARNSAALQGNGL